MKSLTKLIRALSFGFAGLILAFAANDPLFAAERSAARLEIVDFDSKVFGNSRKLRVWLPPGYGADPARLYPVLYMNDGQSLFDAETSFYTGAEWRMDETAEALIEAGEIEPFVIVGMDNGGRGARENEYLPWEDVYLTPPLADPHGADYPRFLFEEVIPFVEARYAVSKRPEDRALGGASYGGLISIYTAALHGDRIGRLLIESASAYVNEAAVLDLAERASAWPERVYIGIGTHEGPSTCRPDNAEMEPIADMRRLQSILLRHDPALPVKMVVEECGLHHEDAYARRLPEALRFLFGSGARD